MAPFRYFIGFCILSSICFAMRASNGSSRLVQVQEVDFDPTLDDGTQNKSAVAESEVDDQEKSVDQTLEDLADLTASPENEMNACVIELNHFIFNF